MGNGVIAPFQDEKGAEPGVKDMRRPPFRLASPPAYAGAARRPTGPQRGRQPGPPAYAGAAGAVPGPSMAGSVPVRAFSPGSAPRRSAPRRGPNRNEAGPVSGCVKATVAPIASTVKGLSSEVPVGPAQGLEHASAISIDNVITIPVAALGRRIGWFDDEQERLLARALVLAYALDVPLPDCSGGGAAPGPGGRGRSRPPAGSGDDDGVGSGDGAGSGAGRTGAHRT